MRYCTVLHYPTTPPHQGGHSSFLLFQLRPLIAPYASSEPRPPTKDGCNVFNAAPPTARSARADTRTAIYWPAVSWRHHLRCACRADALTTSSFLGGTPPRRARCVEP